MRYHESSAAVLQCSPRAVTLLKFLMEKAHNITHSSFWRISKIIKECKFSRSTYHRAIRELVKSGFVTVKERTDYSGRQMSNEYIIHIDKLTESSNQGGSAPKIKVSGYVRLQGLAYKIYLYLQAKCGRKGYSLKTNSFKIKLESSQYPATFVAYDCLYYDDYDITLLPLTERRKFLKKIFKTESGRLAVSRIYESDQAESLFEITLKQGLEGIVAKRKESLYFQSVRTKDWLKIKHLQDDDFVICGYIDKGNHLISLVLGQYNQSQIIYKGHVTLGVSQSAFNEIRNVPVISSPPFYIPVGNENANENAVWLVPKLVCVVKYMYKTDSGNMRQPVFKGLRDDKLAKDCIDKSSY